MSKPTLSYGLNLSKKSGATKPQPSKRKALFGDSDDESDDGASKSKVPTQAIQDLDDFDDFGTSTSGVADSSRKPKSKAVPAPPSRKPRPKHGNAMFGDLSSTLTSKKYADAAQDVDASIYDYDGVYDSMKPQSRKETPADKERKPKYMSNLLAAAAVRKRDALIAEEKKIAREREAEGDEFKDKEAFVTESYKRQQEENRRIEEAEKRKEEDERRKNAKEGGGMAAFYRRMLDRDGEKHSEVVKAAETGSGGEGRGWGRGKGRGKG